MNMFYLIELLEKNDLNYIIDEIFYDENNIIIDPYNNDEIDIDELYNEYEYEFIIEIYDVDNINELIKEIKKIDDELTIEINNKDLKLYDE